MTHHPQANEREDILQQEPWCEDEVPRGWQDLLELLSDQGFDGMARAMQLLFNEAMILERSAVLGARPFERTPLRRGQANGFKPKTVQTRLGPLALKVPQTRGVEFYPSALERGQRSERALKLAIAEMYVQGVTTRKVTAVMERLCGLEVTSTQVSRAMQALNAELATWRRWATGKSNTVSPSGTFASSQAAIRCAAWAYFFTNSRSASARLGALNTPRSSASINRYGIAPTSRWR